MPHILFNAQRLEKLQCPQGKKQEDYYDQASRTPGFGVRVFDSGKKSFFITYRISGKMRRKKLGTYPIVTLADGRELAARWLEKVQKGVDPVQEKKERERLQKQAVTFKALAEDYLDLHARPNKRSAREDERQLNSYILPEWGDLAAKEIRKNDVIRLLDGIARRAPVQANRTRALIHKIFNWAISKDRLENNPCYLVKKSVKESSRERVLTTQEIAAFWKALEDEPFMIAGIFRLILLTAQRPGEVKSMEWTEIDMATGWWTIPVVKSKNRLSHRVFLAHPVIRILQNLRQEMKPDETPWVFPGVGDTGHLVNLRKAVGRIIKRAGIQSFRPHDLRRTASTQMTSNGIPRLTVAKILNHMEKGVTSVYDRASYDREKQEALTWWGRQLTSIVSGLQVVKSAEEA